MPGVFFEASLGCGLIFGVWVGMVRGMEGQKKLFLLDGMALAYRAHFALINKPIRNSKGMVTSAIYGFTQTLVDLLEKHRPTHLAVCVDTAAPTPRHKIYAGYKAQREEMPEDLSKALPWIRRVLEGFRVPVIERDGYEADDLIGSLARRAEAEGFEVYMVTPDKDFGQLVTERTRIWKPGRQGGEAEILGPREVCERWGIREVSQVVDLLGLMGDSSDNIPGVPGIGEKTAAKLIAEFGSLEGVLAQTDRLKGKQREQIEAHAEQALLSKQLATIMTDVPLDWKMEDLVHGPLDVEGLQRTFRELEFNSLGRRLFGDSFEALPRLEGRHGSRKGGGKQGNADDPLTSHGENGERSWLTLEQVPHEFTAVTSRDGVEKLAQTLRQAGAFAFDTETDHLETLQAGLVGLAFAISGERAWVVHFSGDAEQDAALLEPLRPVFADPGLTKVGHHLKFDLGVLLAQGVEVCGPFFDTMLAHALIEPEMRHGLDRLAGQYLGYRPIAIEELIGEGKDSARMREVPLDRLTDYAAEDAVVTWRLHEVFKPRLKEWGQERVFYEIESPLLPVLARMEHEGVAVDVQVLSKLSESLAEESAAIEAQIESSVGRSLNLNSPKQLGQLLFDELKLVDKPKRTKSGQYVTSEQVLESLAPLHPIVRQILEYREINKLRSTYVDALPSAVSPVDGRIHTTFHQAATSTGRLASQNPNLQNIPVRSERGRAIRRAFVAGRPDHVLMAADYSQIELRIMAAMSRDPGLRQAFCEGQDIHAATAARVYGVELAEVDAEMRRRAKMVNFGIIYGISAFGLSQRLGIPRAEAAQIIEAYFEKYPGVKDYMERTIAEARERGYVETLTGRRRYLPEIRSSNGTVRAAAERNAINAPIQGSAADMIKLAMVKVAAVLQSTPVKMILQVHDELLFEGPQDAIDEVRDKVVQAMAGALPLDGVPVVVETGVGRDWLSAH